MSIVVKNFKKSGFWSKCSEISILVKIVEKFQIWWKLSKNLDFGQNFRKFSIWFKSKKNVDFFIKILENDYFSQSYQKDWLWSKFL